MTRLFSHACKIAKQVTSEADRGPIREVLRSLITVPGSQMHDRSRVSLEYYARRHRLQFSGMLLLNSYIDEGNARLPLSIRLQPLTDEQHRWLGAGDRFIRAVNVGLIAPITKKLGAWAAGCDPYASIRPLTYHPTTPTHDTLIESCSSAIAATADILAEHPGVDIIAELVPDLATANVADVLQAVQVAKSTIEDLPARPTQADIKILRGESSTSDPRMPVASRALCQLYLIRNAIALIDSILYDAFISDKIVLLNDDNVFEVEGQKSDVLGPMNLVKLQPQSQELHIDKGDVVLAKVPGYPELQGPALVEGYGVDFHHELGMTMRFKLRSLDEWLNPYPRLTQPTLK